MEGTSEAMWSNTFILHLRILKPTNLPKSIQVVSIRNRLDSRFSKKDGGKIKGMRINHSSKTDGHYLLSLMPQVALVVA